MNDDIDMIDIDDDDGVLQIADITRRQRYGFTQRNTFQNAHDSLYDHETPIQFNDETNIPQNNSQASIYLVIDTNFIISHLRLLNELQHLHTEYHDIYRIIIPKQVMQELDGLKKDKSYENGLQIGQLCRSAIDWCYKNMHDNDTTVKGQKLYECIDRTTEKDDSILDCCLYFKSKYPDSLVILMTNDKNLCVKALSNEILTISYRKGMTAPLIASKITDEAMMRNSSHKSTSTNVINNQNQCLTEDIDDAMLVDEDEAKIDKSPALASQKLTLSDASNTIYNQVQVLVLEVIDYAVKTVFNEDTALIGYDPTKIKSLRDACYEIKQLKISTFSEFFSGHGVFKPLQILEDHDQLIKYSSKPASVEEFKDFKEFWSRFLEIMYHKRSPSLNHDLETIMKSWNTLESELD